MRTESNPENPNSPLIDFQPDAEQRQEIVQGLPQNGESLASGSAKVEAVVEKTSGTSTGPRTPEGKRRSKLNAIQHGILADIILTGEPFRESLEAYNRLHEHLREDIQPVGALEEVEVEHLVFEYLRLTRFYKADVQVAPRVFKCIEDGLNKVGDTTIFGFEDPEKAAVGVRKELASELLLRYGNSVSKQIHNILDRIERLQRMRKGQPLAPRVDVNIS